MQKAERVIVEGVNLRKKHLKPTQINPDGGILSKNHGFMFQT